MEGAQVRAIGDGEPAGVRGDATDRRAPRSERLAAASRELEAVLESVDLGAEPELADALVGAVTATQRARDAVTSDADRSRPE